jgi:hypothetical protein
MTRLNKNETKLKKLHFAFGGSNRCGMFSAEKAIRKNRPF